mmetsp:Transcript_65566/g.106283  ORF Transcript_65566/g.106283 Transcript_65566/m.106283 type:complete len:343 (-) Transcript_65566:827-1855(-)
MAMTASAMLATTSPCPTPTLRAQTAYCAPPIHTASADQTRQIAPPTPLRLLAATTKPSASAMQATTVSMDRAAPSALMGSIAQVAIGTQCAPLTPGITGEVLIPKSPTACAMLGMWEATPATARFAQKAPTALVKASFRSAPQTRTRLRVRRTIHATTGMFARATEVASCARPTFIAPRVTIICRLRAQRTQRRRPCQPVPMIASASPATRTMRTPHPTIGSRSGRALTRRCGRRARQAVGNWRVSTLFSRWKLLAPYATSAGLVLSAPALTGHGSGKMGTKSILRCGRSGSPMHNCVLLSKRVEPLGIGTTISPTTDWRVCVKRRRWHQHACKSFRLSPRV